MLGGDNMAEVFGDLLAKAGGMFKPVKLDPPTEAEKVKRLERAAVQEDMRPKMREPEGRSGETNRSVRGSGRSRIKPRSDLQHRHSSLK